MMDTMKTIIFKKVLHINIIQDSILKKEMIIWPIPKSLSNIMNRYSQISTEK